MGFFDLFNTFRKGKKNDLEDAKKAEQLSPTTIDNLQIGGNVMFSFLPLLDDLSENSATITGNMNFKIEQPDGDPIHVNYASLDDTFFIRKEGNKVEVMKEIEDIETFLQVAGDAFNDIMEIDFETEVEETSEGFPLLTENQKNCTLSDKFDWLSEGQYNVTQDSLVAKVDNKDIRFLRLKSMDKKNFITLFSVDGGETFIYESVLLNKSDVSFI